MKKLIFITLLLYCLIPYAQETTTLPVWDLDPQFSSIDTIHNKENVVGIFYKERNEFYYDVDGRLFNIQTIHKKYRLKSDESINDFNKITVGMSSVVELLEIKARVIKPDGKVIILDEDNIKEVEDEDVEKGLTIFAIDGIEQGDDVEYYIMMKKYSSNFGRVFYQFSYPMLKASFEIISPDNLLYDIKGYNGFEEIKKDKLSNERNHYLAEMENIPSIKDEKFSYVTPRKARIDYRLDYNTSGSPAQILTWDDAAQQIYSIIYQDVNPKHISKWMKSIEIDKKGTLLEKAAQVEEYLKKNVYLQEDYVPGFYDLLFVYKNKVTNSRGMVRLYANIFDNLGIDHTVILTSERNDVKFDKDFQSWNFLGEYLIYLPKEDKYIDPSDFSLRIGYANGELTATDGLFMERVKIGDYESAIAKIKYIEPLPYDMNYHNMKIDISVDADKSEATVISTVGFKGLSGGYFGRIYEMMDEESKEDLLSQLSTINAPVSEFTKLEVISECDVDYMKDAGFITYSEITTPTFIEVAGNKLILKVGETIGQQVEMYFEEDRKSIIENDFNRKYYRVITVKVPEGYKISNPEVGNMNFVENINGKDAFAFTSSYTYENDIYTIILEEYYKDIFVELDHLEGYKDVVNAAADFNNVVLMLEVK